MEKEKLKRIIDLITPDFEEDPINEDFSSGWNACRERLEENFNKYLSTLD
jgi:hypothetical protein